MIKHYFPIFAIGMMLFLFGVILGTYNQWSYAQAHRPAPVNCSCNCPQVATCETPALEATESCSCPPSYQERCDLPGWQRIALAVAQSHEYVLNSYNCAWFANSFAAEERAAGYDAEAMVTRVDCSSGLFSRDICDNYNGKHKIGKLTTYWETITGQEIPPEDYAGYGIVVQHG